MVKGGKDNNVEKKRPNVFHRPSNAATSTEVHDADPSRQSEEVIESDTSRQNDEVIDCIVADVDQAQDDVHLHTTNIREDCTPTIPEAETVSQSKVESIPLPVDELLSGYRLIDINILSILFKHVSCSRCKPVGLLLTQKQQKLDKLLCLHFLVLTVTGNMNSFPHQKKSKMYEINYKAVYSMRRCGKGYQGLRKSLALIDHPPPMTDKN